MSDILYGVAAAQGLIECDQLAHRVDMQTNHMTWLLAEVCSKATSEVPLARQRTGAGRCPHRRYPAPATSPGSGPGLQTGPGTL
jgi:hypothetical protein